MATNPERDPITRAVIEDPVRYEGHYYERHTFEEWMRLTEGAVPEPEEIPAEELERISRERRAHQELALDAQNGLDLIIPASLKTLIQKRLIGAEYEPPDVIVVGKESDGKSLTLSRTIVRPIFPFRDNICTIMPVKVKLSTTAKASIPVVYAVEIQEDGSRKKVPTTVYNFTGQHRDQEAPILEDYVPLDHLQQAIDERMTFLVDQLHGKETEAAGGKKDGGANANNNNNGQGDDDDDDDDDDVPVLGGELPGVFSVSPARAARRQRRPVSMVHEIVVELKGPHFPNVNIVDLPGIVCSDTANTNLPKQTRELAIRYLSQRSENCFVCAVMSAQHSMMTNEALSVLRECNVIPNTIGILSKTDLCHPELVRETRFTRESLDLGYGVCLVANKIHDDERLTMDKFTHMEHVEEDELQRLLDNDKLTPQQRDALRRWFGIRVVQRSLRLSFETYLCEVWVRRTQQALRRSLQDFELKLDALGYPYCRLPEEEGAAAVRLQLRELEPDIGASEPGQSSGHVARAVLDHVAQVLPTFAADTLLCVEQHRRLTVLLRTVSSALAEARREPPVKATQAHALRARLHACWQRVRDAFVAFAASLREQPLSRVLADAVLDHLLSVPAEINVARFSSLRATLHENLVRMFEERVDAELRRVTDAFIDDRLSSMHSALRMALVDTAPGARGDGACGSQGKPAAMRTEENGEEAKPAALQEDGGDVVEQEVEKEEKEEEEAQAEGSASKLPEAVDGEANARRAEALEEVLWTPRVLADGETLVHDLATLLLDVGTAAQSVLHNVCLDEDCVVEDSEVTRERAQTFRHIQDVCEVLLEIHAALDGYEQRKMERSMEQLNAEVEAAELVPPQQLDLADSSGETTLMLGAMRNRIQGSEENADKDTECGVSEQDALLFEDVKIETNTADSLRQALAMCRLDNRTRTLTLKSNVLSDVLPELGRALADMTALESLCLTQCDLTHPQLQETFRLGFQRNTTMTSLTIENCWLGEDSNLLSDIVSLNTTLRHLFVDMPTDDEKELEPVKTILAATASATPDQAAAGVARVFPISTAAAMEIVTAFRESDNDWDAVRELVWEHLPHLSRSKRDEVLEAAKCRVPIDRRERRRWNVDDRVCFVRDAASRRMAVAKAIEQEQG